MTDDRRIIPERKRSADEITPVSAEQSATINGNEFRFGAGKVIDLDPATASWTAPGSDRTAWLKINLDKVHCVHNVITFYKGTPQKNWTCTDMECNCVGSYCSRYTLTISTRETLSPYLTPVTHCKYGDTIQMQRIEAKEFKVYEIAIVGEPGTI